MFMCKERLYIYIVTILWCLLIGVALAPLLLCAPRPLGYSHPAIELFFRNYLWGERLLSENASISEAIVANMLSCVVWGVVVGKILITIAVKRKSEAAANA